MKNNRLSGFIIFAIAILVVGGLTYYEFNRLPPKEIVLGNPPETDEPLSLGDQSTVPPAPMAQQNQPAPAVDGTTAKTPATPPPATTATAESPSTTAPA